ncbi:MAG TPA: PAS domain S-box protein [Terriglobales bacterium]|nr:PAS domain S-box protein [Terriglobales bacterium]
MSGAHTHVRANDTEELFQRLLLDISAASSQGADYDALIRLFCERAREFFGVSGAYCWKLASQGAMEAVAASGYVADQVRGAKFPLERSTLAVDAVRSRRTLYRNRAESSGCVLAAGLPFKSAMAAPLIVAGEAVGALAFVHEIDADYFNDGMATQATIVAGLLGTLMQAARLSQASRQEHQRAENLVDVASELNSSLRLVDFVQRFTERAAVMMGAKTAVLALSKEGVLETVALHGGPLARDNAVLRPLSYALGQAVRATREPVLAGDAVTILGQALSQVLQWTDVTVAQLTGASGELIGVICLADRAQPLRAEDRKLLQALASHASVALENSRLFTRMDQANRHWIEIFDAITDFIVVHDETNHVLRVNRSFADFIGVRPSELIGFSMRALSMSNEAEEQPCPFCRAGLDSADEYIHPLSEHTYLISTSRIHGAVNESFQTIHVLKDITDRREAERRYRELFDNIQEGLYFSSPEGNFIEVNDALVRMLGYDSREELLRVDISSQIFVSAEHRARSVEILQQTGILRNYENTLRRKDGSLIHVLQNAFAVKDVHGRVLQYRGLMMDITELKNFQAELQRERDFSSKILNNTQSLILVVDTAGLISYANRRCYQPGNFRDVALLGRPLTEIVVPDRRTAMAEALESTLEGKQVDNLELPLTLGNGRMAQFSINLSPMRDEQGNVNSIVVVMTDITDAAMLQAKLVHTEKMAAVGQLVSGVAHEVNNPLTAVLGFADLLLEDPTVPDGAKHDIGVILQEAQRTKQIVQNLLSFARQTPPNRQSVQINDILRRTLALRAYDFANRGLKIVETLDEHLPEIIGDAHQLQQVFLNIINNAYDAVCETARLGRIEIETCVSGDSAEVHFRDNGNGIKHPERIFDPFFTTKEVGKGTGLGLSICYGIVREHGGEISCHNNEGPHAPGATFVVRLPLKACKALAQSNGAY